MGFASSSNSVASCRGNASLRNHEPPPSGVSPTRAYDMTNFASCAATIMSQASASEKPAPAAAPSTAAMTGLVEVRSARIHCASKSMLCACTEASFARFSSNRLRLPPAQKKSSAPVNTTARMDGSRSAVSSATIAAAYMSGWSALRAPGFDSVRTSVESLSGGRAASSSALMESPGSLSRYQRRASRSSAVASVSSRLAKQKRTMPDSCGSW